MSDKKEIITALLHKLETDKTASLNSLTGEAAAQLIRAQVAEIDRLKAQIKELTYRACPACIANSP